jgi:transglutaminase-like putative cysteine protease
MIRNPDITDLRWLLLGMGLVMGLHIAHFAPWVTVSVLVLGTWRFLIEHYRWKMPSVIVLIPLTVLAALGIMLTYRGLFGRDASVELLALMLMLKLMEAKTNRDFIILIFGGYFLTITTFLFTQSMAYGAAMLLSTFVLTATLVGISHPNGNLRWQFQAKVAGSLLAQATPIMLALFLLFPRIPGPLWGLPQDTNQGVSGLSESMEPGNISDLTLSGKIAFRVEFEGNPPPSSNLYWRGPVLWHYDGRSWTKASQNLDIPNESLTVRGSATRYNITMEPSNQHPLLLLDMPVELPPDSTITRDFQVLSKQPVRTRIRYEASSHLDYALGVDVNERTLELNLQIPDIDNPRTRALAQQWLDQGKNPEAIIQTALSMFREQDFIYTLRPPLLGVEPIDDFLFNTKRGFCEHYAGSFVYLMRAAGVPARVVTGYQGGEMNPVGNYMIVRQSDAHAWAEVWLAGKGWVRVDPTGAVSPFRIESGIETAIPDSNVLPLLARKHYPLLKKLYLNLDAVDNAWNHWVLEYNQKRQMELLSRLAGAKLSWIDLAIAMAVSVGIVGLTLTYFLLRDHPSNTDPLQRIYLTFLRKIKRRGITRHPHEGPVDFSKRAIKQLPNKAGEISLITGIYTELRYGNKHDLGIKRDPGNKYDMDSITKLKQLVKRFK